VKKKINWNIITIRALACVIGGLIVTSMLLGTNALKFTFSQLMFHSPYLLIMVSCWILSIEKKEEMEKTFNQSIMEGEELNANGGLVVIVQESAAKTGDPEETVKSTSEPDKKTETKDKGKSVTFADIAGYEATKKSVQFVVKCLKNQKALNEIGAKLPSGILLYGPPGTGKTYMAKAIAGEAQVPFLSASAASFVNTYVGVGAKNVRALYAEARKKAPCVVFIDELDAIGSSRKGENTNSEIRATLNELLIQIDGISSSNDILTIAATNTPDDLDAALVRAVRFDRKIAMPLPYVKEREEILKIHCQNKQVASNIDFHKLAVATPGFSGSALATLANEAAIHAVYQEKNLIDTEDFDHAMFQIVM